MSYYTNARTDWLLKSDSLYSLYQADKISEKQWWRGTRELAGSISSQQVWVMHNSRISAHLLRKLRLDCLEGTRLFIANAGVPNKHTGSMSLYLLNQSGIPISIPRKDATISRSNVLEYVYLDSRWVMLHDEYFISGCGNGYFTAQLHDGYYLRFEADAKDEPEGSVSVMYKMVMKISGRAIESNHVAVRMFPNQLQRIIDDEGSGQSCSDR